MTRWVAINLRDALEKMSEIGIDFDNRWEMFGSGQGIYGRVYLKDGSVFRFHPEFNKPCPNYVVQQAVYVVA